MKKERQIFLSFFLSFIIVVFIIPFFTSPKKIDYFKNNIFNSFNFLKLFTLSIGSYKENKEKSYLITQKINNNQNSFFILTPMFVPRPTSEVAHGLSEKPTPTIFNENFNNQFQIILTNTPKPTKPPKPTKIPDVFPIDSSLARPGKTADEVFQIASEKTCVPKEILKAIAYIESGGFFDVVPPKYFLLYNSYNWWNSEFLTEEKRICGGYGYDQNTGIVPEDSKFAGYKCKEGYNSGLNVMGVMSVSSSEQSKYGKKVASLLGVKQADRRVILDALMIVGLIIKDNVKPSSCSNWSGHDIVKAACGYYGSCGIADGTYYCATFCRNYKKFGGKGSCDASSFGDDCWK